MVDGWNPQNYLPNIGEEQAAVATEKFSAPRNTLEPQDKDLCVHFIVEEILLQVGNPPPWVFLRLTVSKETGHFIQTPL